MSFHDTDRGLDFLPKLHELETICRQFCFVTTDTNVFHCLTLIILVNTEKKRLETKREIPTSHIFGQLKCKHLT